jgi:Ca-activated chloride channel homolog
MTIQHPAILALLALPLGYAAYEWRRTTRKTALALKVASLGAIIAALSEPSVTLPETKTGVVVLVDTSGSISNEDLKQEASIVSTMAGSVGRNWMRVIPFARRVREVAPEEVRGGWAFRRTSGGNEEATDFEGAIREGISAIPSGRIPRLAIISDGKENQGSTARGIAQLQRLSIPVDAFPLGGRSESGLRLLSVSAPAEAYAGEQIPIDLTVQSPIRTTATLSISAEGKVLGQQPAALEDGVTQVHVNTRINSTGATTLAGRLALQTGSSVEFEQAIDLKRAEALYISGDPAGTEVNLIKALNQAQFVVKQNAKLLDSTLSDFQLVILNNLNLSVFTLQQKSRLEEYVRNGGGLLLIGGEKQIYKESKQMDALDRVLPAQLAPPKSPEGTCVALIIDKSSSMEGRKIELARLSAIGVVDHLRPTDLIGVLIFDNSYQWAVPMRRAEDKSLIKRLISGITPDGGTQIAPALNEAYRRVMNAHATYKHIVLLTDGISEEGDSLELAREAQSHQLTISTVGLGQDVNRSYLDRVANFSGGKSYFLNDPQGLEQILLKDVLEYTGSTSVERPLRPLVDKKAEVLKDTGIESAPPLKGYVRFRAKPTSETILSIDEEKRDPLYTRWQYGLGRAAVFSSDAKSRWAADWVSWPGFDKFWINVTRDLLPHTRTTEALAQFDAANNDLVVEYRLGAAVSEPPDIPQIYVLGPGSFEKPIDVRRTSPGVYHGRLHLGDLRGLFRIRPLAETRAFPEIGFYRQQQEMLDYGSDPGLLRQISNLTGGRFNPAPEDIFRSNGRYIPSPWRLWPALLALTIALTIAELAVRKWRGIFQRSRGA